MTMNRIRILQMLFCCVFYVGRTKTQQVCVPTWTEYPNQHSIGADEQIGVNDLLECISVCEYTPGCVAIDFDLKTDPHACWTHPSLDDLTSENTYTDEPDVTQYIVDRTSCLPRDTGCLVEWSVTPNQNSLYGIQSPQWLPNDCFTLCRYTPSCVGIDFDVTSNPPPPCWLHTSEDDLTNENTYDSDTAVQYRINRTCPAPPTTNYTLGRCAGQSFPNGSWCPSGQQIHIVSASYKVHPLCCYEISDNTDPPPDSPSLNQFNIFQGTDAMYIADIQTCEGKDSCMLKSQSYQSGSVTNDYCPKQPQTTNYVSLSYSCLQSDSTTTGGTESTPTTVSTPTTMGTQTNTASGMSTIGDIMSSGQWIYPPACIPDSSCTYTASWSLDQMQDVVTFTIVAQQPTTTWTAIGIAPQPLMQNVDVVYSYINSQGQGVVYDGWIGSQHTRPNPDPMQNLLSSNITYMNGYLTLKFSRNRTSSDLQNDYSFTNTDCYYFLFPVGGGTYNPDGTINMHSSVPRISENNICISNAAISVGSSMSTATSVGSSMSSSSSGGSSMSTLSSVGSSMSSSSSVGSTMSSSSSGGSSMSTQSTNIVSSGLWIYPPACIPDSSCTYTASWSLDQMQDVVTFTIVAQQPTTMWTAIGIAPQPLMQNVDVVYSYINSQGLGVVYDGWIGSQHTRPNPDPMQNLLSSNITYMNGYLTLKFSRNRISSDLQNDYSFTNTDCYYFLFPVGGGTYNPDGTINMHSSVPRISENKICISSAAASGSSPDSSMGSSMTTAGSVGSSMTTASSVGSSTTTAGTVGSFMTTAGSVASSMTTAGSVGSFMTTAGSVGSSMTTAGSVESSMTTAGSAGSFATTAGSVGSSMSTANTGTTMSPTTANIVSSGQWIYPPACIPDSSCTYTASWSLDQMQDVVTFTIVAQQPTTTWTAIGIAPQPLMQNVDVVYSYINSQGLGVVYDGWIGSQHTRPNPDSMQNLLSSNITYMNGYLTLKFSRNRTSSDLQNDYSFTNTDCYYFLFPVGGGTYNPDGTINMHSSVPRISDNKICISSAVASGSSPVSSTSSTIFTPSISSSISTTSNVGSSVSTASSFGSSMSTSSSMGSSMSTSSSMGSSMSTASSMGSSMSTSSSMGSSMSTSSSMGSSMSTSSSMGSSMSTASSGTTMSPTSGEVCLTEWDDYPSIHSINGIQVDCENLQDGLSQCEYDQLCLAVDYSTATIPPCWLHYSATDLDEENTYDGDNTTTQYRKTEVCLNSSGCSQLMWNRLPDTSSFYGVPYNHWTEYDCFTRCLLVTECIAIDFDVSATPPCWLHINPDDLSDENSESFPGQDIVQYRLNKTTCQAESPTGPEHEVGRCVGQLFPNTNWCNPGETIHIIDAMFKVNPLCCYIVGDSAAPPDESMLMAWNISTASPSYYNEILSCEGKPSCSFLAKYFTDNSISNTFCPAQQSQTNFVLVRYGCIPASTGSSISTPTSIMPASGNTTSSTSGSTMSMMSSSTTSGTSGSTMSMMSSPTASSTSGSTMSMSSSQTASSTSGSAMSTMSSPTASSTSGSAMSMSSSPTASSTSGSTMSMLSSPTASSTSGSTMSMSSSPTTASTPSSTTVSMSSSPTTSTSTSIMPPTSSGIVVTPTTSASSGAPLSSSTAVMSSTTTRTTTPVVTVTQRRYENCSSADDLMFCGDLHGSLCYDETTRQRCCNSCSALLTSIPGCEYGDRYPIICEALQGSNDKAGLCPVYSDDCCFTCSQ